MNTLTQVTNFVAILWASEIKSRFCKNSRCSKISKLTLFLAKIISKELLTIRSLAELREKTGLRRGNDLPSKLAKKVINLKQAENGLQSRSSENGSHGLSWTSWHGLAGLDYLAWTRWHGLAGMDWLAWTRWHGLAGMDWLAWTGWHGLAGMDWLAWTG